MKNKEDLSYNINHKQTGGDLTSYFRNVLSKYEIKHV